MRSQTRVPAVLHGPEGESKCILEIWQEISSTGRVFTRCRIADEAPELPDGPYRVTVGDQSVRTWKTSGNWELVFLPQEIAAEYFPRMHRAAS